MISTIADLLEAFRLQEAKMLKNQKISHSPTIGKMYEGLTKVILTRGIPLDLDLYVVSGIINNSKGQTSRQIDCMLVSGKGEKIPYTDDYVYNIKNVLAVIEVKKNLYNKDLDSAYNNLLSVRNIQESLPHNNLYNDAVRAIIGVDADIYKSIHDLPYWKSQIMLALYSDSLSPVRIVFGYDGFANEYRLRKSFIDYLGNKMFVSGYGVADLPDLLICGQYSLVKMNGMPYATPIIDSPSEIYDLYGLPNLSQNSPVSQDLWHVYSSFSGNPLIILLELIWTQLTYKKNLWVSEYASDLRQEVLKPLLFAKCLKLENRTGWYYEYFHLTKKVLNQLNQRTPSTSWTPTQITLAQTALLAFLTSVENEGNYDGVSIHSPDISQEYAGEKLVDSIKYLQQHRLVSLENDRLTLLTRELRVATLPDGTFVAGDDHSGRFSKWLMESIKEFKRKGKQEMDA